MGCDVSVLLDFHSCREGVHFHRCCPSLDLKWVEVPGNCRPAGSEVDNVALQQALRERREFWHSEFEEFKIGERLSPLSFICLDGIYFQPAVPATEFEGTDGLPDSPWRPVAYVVEWSFRIVLSVRLFVSLVP